MVNFKDKIDEYVAERRDVAVSVGNNIYSGHLIARGDDYIELEGQYTSWIVPIDKIVSI